TLSRPERRGPVPRDKQLPAACTLPTPLGETLPIPHVGPPTPLHAGNGRAFGRFADRNGGLLLTEPIVDLIAGSLGPAATLLLRPYLGVSQLNGIAARPARAESVPEPAESLPLLRIGPDHQMSSAARSSRMDIALLGPFLESTVAHAQFVRQVANPPFVG